MTFSEIRGLYNALQSITGELTNNVPKLTELDKEVAHEKQKIEEGKDEISWQQTADRLKLTR